MNSACFPPGNVHYVTPKTVKALQWAGDNFEEMEEFIFTHDKDGEFTASETNGTLFVDMEEVDEPLVLDLTDWMVADGFGGFLNMTHEEYSRFMKAGH